MCYNLQTSLLGWVVSQYLAGVMFIRNKMNDRWNALFLMTFSQIQLVESLIWAFRTYETNHHPYNKFLGSAIVLVLWAQPLSQSLGAFFQTRREEWKYLSILYLGLLLSSFYTMYQSTFSFSLSSDHHLVWNRYSGTEIQPQGILGSCRVLDGMYFIGLGLGLVWMKPVSHAISLLGFGGISLLLTRFLFSSSESFGSMWCLISVMYGIIAYSLPILFPE